MSNFFPALKVIELMNGRILLFQDRNKSMNKLVIVLSCLVFSCNQPNFKELSPSDIDLLKSMAFGSKTFAIEFGSKSDYEQYSDLILKANMDKVMNQKLDLLGVGLTFGAENTGLTYKSVGLIKSLKTGKSLTFNFFDDHCFSCGGDTCQTQAYLEAMKDCTNQISLDHSMNFIAREFELQEDSIAVGELGRFILSDLFSQEELKVEERLEFEYQIHRGFCDCCDATLDQTLETVFTNLSNRSAKYFKTFSTGGLWELKIVRINNQEWSLDLDYVNEACVYKIGI